MLHQEKRTWKVHLKETEERSGNTKKWRTVADRPECSVRGLVRGSLTLAIHSGNSVTQYSAKSSLNQIDGIDSSFASHEKWTSSLLLKGADSEEGMSLF